MASQPLHEANLSSGTYVSQANFQVCNANSSSSSSSSSTSAGEETHVAPDSSKMIDTMTNLFPWNITTKTVAPLRMEDIEVQINYRTPRIDHVASIWHQLGKRKTMREFLGNAKSLKNLYQSNSLGVALQFVRKGIKTTIVDMAGVLAQKSTTTTTATATHSANNITVVGGLQGVVACDILRVGRNKTQDDGGGLWCDSNSNLYMAGLETEVKSKNLKKDKSERALTEEQLQAINRALEEYDCGVWQHLQKYQEQGLLRFLYPSEHLFSTCNNLEMSPDIPFSTLLENVRRIAKS